LTPSNRNPNPCNPTRHHHNTTPHRAHPTTTTITQHNSHLSLVELEAAFKGLFSRLPGLRLAAAPHQLEWTDPRRDVGLARVPVAW
jgi:hypothetical protein